jgi:hypothetical protein
MGRSLHPSRRQSRQWHPPGRIRDPAHAQGGGRHVPHARAGLCQCRVALFRVCSGSRRRLLSRHGRGLELLWRGPGEPRDRRRQRCAGGKSRLRRRWRRFAGRLLQRQGTCQRRRRRADCCWISQGLGKLGIGPRDGQRALGCLGGSGCVRMDSDSAGLVGVRGESLGTPSTRISAEGPEAGPGRPLRLAWRTRRPRGTRKRSRLLLQFRIGRIRALIG